MEQQKFFNDLFGFMKTNYETALKTMEMAQDQAEKTLNIMVEQGAAIQGESQKAMKEWANYGKKIREEYKKYSEEYLKKMESYQPGFHKSGK